jgi:hypothetical protein
VVGTEHLLLAAAALATEPLLEVFREFGITRDALSERLETLIGPAPGRVADSSVTAPSSKLLALSEPATSAVARARSSKAPSAVSIAAAVLADTPNSMAAGLLKATLTAHAGHGSAKARADEFRTRILALLQT